MDFAPPGGRHVVTQLAGGVFRIGEVIVELAGVDVAHVPAREPRSDAAPTNGRDVVLEAFAAQAHQRRPRHATQPLSTQQAGEMAERILVAHFNQIRLLVFQNPPHGAATREKRVRQQQAVAGIDNRRARRGNVINAPELPHLLHTRLDARHDEPHRAARGVGRRQHRAIERTDAARGGMIRVGQVQCLDSHAPRPGKLPFGGSVATAGPIQAA